MMDQSMSTYALGGAVVAGSVATGMWLWVRRTLAAAHARRRHNLVHRIARLELSGMACAQQAAENAEWGYPLLAARANDCAALWFQGARRLEAELRR